MSQTKTDYNLVYITAEGKQETGEKIKNWIAESAGSIGKEESWGKKTLAFPIKKNKSGHYFSLNFQMTPESVRQLTKKLDFETEIMRYLLMK